MMMIWIERSILLVDTYERQKKIGIYLLVLMFEYEMIMIKSN